MKHRHYSRLTQALYFVPVSWAALTTGCQGMAASSFVLIEPPGLIEAASVTEVRCTHLPSVDQFISGAQESAPTLGPGHSVPTPTRLAQPTLSQTPSEKSTTSAAPGLYEARSAAQTRALLLKATAALQAKDFDGALVQLDRYLRAYPDAALIRLQAAELHFQQSRYSEARRHFSQAIGEVIDPVLPIHCRLHAHSRLMEIAGQQRDRFSESLHRGIGLMLLAEHRRDEQSKEGAPVQELLGKARAALQRAALLSPQDARPALYLIAVWQGMQQHNNASLALAQARHLSLGAQLNAWEQMMLAQWSVELRAVRE